MVAWKVLKTCATFLWSRLAIHTGCTFQTLTVTGFLALAQFSPFQCQLLSWLCTCSCSHIHAKKASVRSHTSDLRRVKKELSEWTLDVKQPSCNDMTHLARPHYSWCWNVYQCLYSLTRYWKFKLYFLICNSKKFIISEQISFDSQTWFYSIKWHLFVDSQQIWQNNSLGPIRIVSKLFSSVISNVICMSVKLHTHITLPSESS